MVQPIFGKVTVIIISVVFVNLLESIMKLFCLQFLDQASFTSSFNLCLNYDCHRIIMSTWRQMGKGLFIAEQLIAFQNCNGHIH